jgi:hypothetical protein
LTSEVLSAIALGGSSRCRHHLDQKRLARGHVKRIEDTLDETQDHDGFDGAGVGRKEGHHCQERGYYTKAKLHDNKHAMPIGAIDKDARERCEKKGRRLPDEADQSENEGLVFLGKAKDEPARGDAGHPRADERNGLPNEEQSVVAMRQRPAESTEFARHLNARLGGHG